MKPKLFCKQEPHVKWQKRKLVEASAIHKKTLSCPKVDKTFMLDVDGATQYNT